MSKAGLDGVASSTSALDLRAASRDLWPGGTLDAWQGRAAPQPGRVFWPETDDEVLAVLRAATASGRPVVPYGAGSGVCGGARGMADAWVLDTKRFDRIGEVDPETWTVEVGAGVNGQHLEDALAAAGWTCGHSPSSIGCSTVGGWAAARGAGQFSSRYGVFEDMVVGLDLVTPGEGALHLGVPGPSSPPRQGLPEWLPQVLGSEGTLGVITRVRLRVRPLPATRWLRGYRFPDVHTALDAMRGLMQGELWPSVVRLYDPLDTWIGGKTRPKKAHGHEAWWKGWLKQVDALPEVRRRLLVLPLSVPGLLQRVAEGLADGVLVIVGWEGPPEVVEAAVAAGRPLLEVDGVDLGPEPGERWHASRHAVSYKLMPVFERGGFADTMEIAGRWTALPRAYEAVRRAVGPHALVMAHMSHVYPEGGCIYFSFAGRGDRAVYDAVWTAALDAVLASGCTVTHHHGVGELKARWASREVGPAVRGWRALSAVLDPRGVLNPGRVLRTGEPPAPLPDDELAPADGLAWVDPARPSADVEPRWPWARLPGLPRWQRSAWQTTWVEVRGEVDGVGCALGRGPRSAAGPDLRGWLATHAPKVRATVGVPGAGPRWMGAARVEQPWRVAQQLLRADLRPGSLGVVDGVLHVGFRGPAAEAFGALASSLVPGGLEAVPWRLVPLAAGVLEPCAVDDPAVVHVTSERAFRVPGSARASG
ncbi:MAG: FAD-binding oxidoreductase [Alphaproteobacteria bacterium]|nr:FAD-binding oxidoreductase [Alphaproteobacteria bacterium]